MIELRAAARQQSPTSCGVSWDCFVKNVRPQRALVCHRILRLPWPSLREPGSKSLTSITATMQSRRPAGVPLRSTVFPSSTAQHHGSARRHDFGLDPAGHQPNDAATTATRLFALTDRSGRLRRHSSDRSLATTANWPLRPRDDLVLVARRLPLFFRGTLFPRADYRIFPQ